ncbi:MAG: dihydrolipoamide acetyltransferase family protein [Actinomycetota bacterium]
MTVPLKMPRLGETVTEGTVVRWLKKEGDYVNKDESIAEVSTAKVETEIPSPASGRVLKIVVHEDETVPVGEDLALIDETAKPEAKPVEAKAPPPPPEVEPKAKLEEKLAVKGKAGFISPVVRKLAREYNIDLSKVQGTGKGGRITRQDIEKYISAQKPAPPEMLKPPIAIGPPISPAPMPSAEVPRREFPGAPAVEAEGPEAAPAPPLRPVPPPREEVKPAPPAEARPEAPPAAMPAEARPEAPPAPYLPGERIVEVSHIRHEIAKHMVQSHSITAHVTAIVEVDMTSVSNQRSKVKETFKQREGFSLTYLPFVAKAAIDALIAWPIVNARFVDEHHVALHDYVNLGIAVALEEGLIVPVIKNAERMNLVGLARSMHDLADKARTGRLTPNDVTGSTFTITNPGSFGSIIQTPIINLPNVAILSLELIQRRPIVIDEAIAIRQMVYMPLSYDHRLIDGAVAAQFLSRIKHNLETWDFLPDLASYM